MNPDRSVARETPVVSAEKEFPSKVALDVVLEFSPSDMEKVKTWYARSRKELGDKFMEDFDVPRLIFEAFAGGAVNPRIKSVLLLPGESNA